MRYICSTYLKGFVTARLRLTTESCSLVYPGRQHQLGTGSCTHVSTWMMKKFLSSSWSTKYPQQARNIKVMKANQFRVVTKNEEGQECLRVFKGNPIKCGNAAYQFDSTISFFINGKLWEVSKTSSTSKFDAGITVVSLINDRTFYPQLTGQGLDDLSKIIQDEKDINSQVTWKKVTTSPVFYGPLLTLICLCLIVALSCYFCRWQRLRVRMRNFHERVRGEIRTQQMRMSDLRGRE